MRGELHRLAAAQSPRPYMGFPVAGKSLHHLTRTPLTWRSGLTAAAASVQSGDDRTAGIIAATTIDVSLERAIRTRFRPLKPSDSDAIFAGTGPLSTFSGKIQIAYAMGLIGPQTRHDFTTIKDIRNVFAHSTRNYSFQTKQIYDRCLGMHIVKRNKNYTEFEDDLFDARFAFLSSTRVFWFLLQLKGNSKKRVRTKTRISDELTS